MKVAIVHDDLVQWGGAERVLLALTEIFPEAPIYTSVFDKANPNLLKNFGEKKVITSFMQKIPGWKYLYKPLLPLYPIAFEQFDFSDFDLVISQTTRFAKSVITKPSTKHICYIHTPPRFLWNFSDPGSSTFYLSYLRLYDQISSRRVDQWLAGSQNCQLRLKKVYKVDSELMYPFVDDQFFRAERAFDGGYYLTVARLNNFKNIDLVVKLFSKTKDRLKVVGVGPNLNQLRLSAGDNVEFMGMVDDDYLINLLEGTRAVIITATEDFGLVSLEAQAMGKPIVGLSRGGILETVIDEKTGVLFDDLNVASLEEALEKLKTVKINSDDCIENARRFSKEKFKRRLISLI